MSVRQTNQFWAALLDFKYFLIFETFCNHAPRNKLRRSTNFIFFGPTDQKLWVLENFWRSLGRASMWWSQWGRVDHMCKNLWARDRKEGAEKVQESKTRAGAGSNQRSPTANRAPSSDCRLLVIPDQVTIDQFTVAQLATTGRSESRQPTIVGRATAARSRWQPIDARRPQPC
jgi:hypothetical protein